MKICFPAFAMGLVAIASAGGQETSVPITTLQAENAALRAELAALRAANDEHLQQAVKLTGAIQQASKEIARIQEQQADLARLLMADIFGHRSQPNHHSPTKSPEEP